jgi:hypothetical protein
MQEIVIHQNEFFEKVKKKIEMFLHFKENHESWLYLNMYIEA